MMATIIISNTKIFNGGSTQGPAIVTISNGFIISVVTGATSANPELFVDIATVNHGDANRVNDAGSPPRHHFHL